MEDVKAMKFKQIGKYFIKFYVLLLFTCIFALPFGWCFMVVGVRHVDKTPLPKRWHVNKVIRGKYMLAPRMHYMPL